MLWYEMIWYDMIDMIWYDMIWYDMICNDAICCELSESVSTMKYHDSMALFRWSHLSPPEAIKCLAYHATLWLSLKLASFSAGELSSPQSCLSNSHLRQRALQTSQTSQTSSYSFVFFPNMQTHITSYHTFMNGHPCRLKKSLVFFLGQLLCQFIIWVISFPYSWWPHLAKGMQEVDGSGTYELVINQWRSHGDRLRSTLSQCLILLGWDR